jgi:hypothetical protein
MSAPVKLALVNNDPLRENTPDESMLNLTPDKFLELRLTRGPIINPLKNV